MKRIVICIAVFGIVFGQRVAMGQDESAENHLRPMKTFIGEWEAEFKVPPGHPEVGEEGAPMVSHLSWRWILKGDFMVGNFTRQVGEKTELGKEIGG